MTNHLFIMVFLSLVYTFHVRHGTMAMPPVEVNIGVILDLSSIAGKMTLASINLALSDLKPENTTGSANLVLHIRDSKGDIASSTAAGMFSFFTFRTYD
jgi:hypothetical protein